MKKILIIILAMVFMAGAIGVNAELGTQPAEEAAAVETTGQTNETDESAVNETEVSNTGDTVTSETETDDTAVTATEEETSTGTETENASETPSEETATEGTATEETAAGGETGEQNDDAREEAGITPDSIIYPLERMLESLQVALTFTQEGKAELLVSFAKERLAEAEIMTEKNKADLVEKVMKVYIDTVKKANEKLDKAAEEGKNVTAAIDEMKIVEDSAGNVILKISGVLPLETVDNLKAKVEEVVKKRIVVDAYIVSKSTLADAKAQVKAAREELENAKVSGDEAAIQAAAEKLENAEQNKKEAEEIKKEVKELKKEIKDEYKDKDKAKDKDDKKTSSDKAQQKIEKEKQKCKKKIEKLEQFIKKHQAKKDQVAKKVKAKSENAGSKIERNTAKQIENKKQQIEKFQKQAEDKIRKIQQKARISKSDDDDRDDD